jgi:hypothetical protein
VTPIVALGQPRRDAMPWSEPQRDGPAPCDPSRQLAILPALILGTGRTGCGNRHRPRGRSYRATAVHLDRP